MGVLTVLIARAHPATHVHFDQSRRKNWYIHFFPLPLYSKFITKVEGKYIDVKKSTSLHFKKTGNFGMSYTVNTNDDVTLNCWNPKEGQKFGTERTYPILWDWLSNRFVNPSLIVAFKFKTCDPTKFVAQSYAQLCSTDTPGGRHVPVSNSTLQ